jgi:hypothetical protein
MGVLAQYVRPRMRSEIKPQRRTTRLTHRVGHARPSYMDRVLNHPEIELGTRKNLRLSGECGVDTVRSHKRDRVHAPSHGSPRLMAATAKGLPSWG